MKRTSLKNALLELKRSWNCWAKKKVKKEKPKKKWTKAQYKLLADKIRKA